MGYNEFLSYIMSKHLLSNIPTKTIIEKLDSYVTDNRKTRIESVLTNRIDHIQIVLENVSDNHNAMAVIRSGEALGITTVHIINPEGTAKESRAVTQGAMQWLDVIFYDDTESFLQKHKDHFVLAGGVLHESKTIAIHEVLIDKPLCLCFGNEQRGLSKQFADACDVFFKIPMFGMTESFNLSVSVAISLYDCLERVRNSDQSKLSNDRYEYLKAKYYLNSVKPRLAEGLLK